MPNVKIYVDETLFPVCRAALKEALPPLRTLLCDALNVDPLACQFAILSAVVMPDLPRVNVEIHILPHADRTRERLTLLAKQVQAQIGAVTKVHTAVRMTVLVPEGYVALK